MFYSLQKKFLVATLFFSSVTATYSLAVPGMPYWNSVTSGPVIGGSGDWNNTTANWTNSGGTFYGPWSEFDAIFTASPGTVTLTDNILFDSITFNTSGYSIVSGGAYNLTTPNTESNGLIVTNPGVTATISANINATNDLVKDGNGTLNLSG